jgi:hypothetical protein
MAKLETRIHNSLELQLKRLNLVCSDGLGFERKFDSQMSGGVGAAYRPFGSQRALRILNLWFYIRHSGIELLCQNAGEIRYTKNSDPKISLAFVPTTNFRSVTISETMRSIFPKEYFRYDSQQGDLEAPFTPQFRAFRPAMSDDELTETVQENVEFIENFGIPWLEKYSTFDRLLHGIMHKEVKPQDSYRLPAALIILGRFEDASKALSEISPREQNSQAALFKGLNACCNQRNLL